ncbi:hypothetical protein [Xanthocytophaga agilis]|uniref:DUF4105 domain-containing protein n=1 Tax=Xanthocytophaga agilis TaxID=3048010 RepID=A0AAE3RAR7_9BACT|nr:hypothetical protein [Xanthocytophaga agilis]MDJ1504579.1 hypothetical protein [Xanthocytophaga agilis]
MQRIRWFLWVLCMPLSVSAYTDMVVGKRDTMKFIKVHFLYGSKPKKEFKFLEKKWFGGMHGGHVSIETDSIVTGFGPKGKFHVFGYKKNFHSHFFSQGMLEWMDDSVGMKYVSVTIPLTLIQYQKLDSIHKTYQNSPPYDYAFVGMRCAAATYHILSQLDLVPVRGHHRMVINYFYPKLLRKRILKLAVEKKYAIHRQSGRITRKWEKD